MEVTKALIQQFLENKCTKEEAERVYAYLLQHPEVLGTWLPEEEWESFAADRPVDTERATAWFKIIQQRRQGKLRRMANSNILRIAVAVILLAISAAIVYRLLPGSPAKPVIVFYHQKDTGRSTEQRFVNKSGQPVEYKLEDGSVVVLSANSDLLIPTHFGTDKRTLTLQGEGVFYVAKDSKRPFTVFTEQFATTALGTVFRIKAYRGKQLASVQLLKGKVMVKNIQRNDEPVFLLPGDECNWTPGNHPLQVTKKKAVTQKENMVVPAVKQQETNSHELVFTNTPLAEVFEKIGQTYQTSIHIQTIDLAGRKFTGTFLKDQPVEEVLSTIAELNNFKVVKEANGYSIQQQ